MALTLDEVIGRQEFTKSMVGSVSGVLGVGNILGVEDLSDNNELLIGSMFLETVLVFVVAVEAEVACGTFALLLLNENKESNGQSMKTVQSYDG